MKKKVKYSLLSIGLMFSINAFATSNDECAIWLCAPMGFAPSSCHSAFKAMIHRVKHFKSPVPSFGSCLVKGNNNLIPSDDASNYSNNSGDVAFIGHDKNKVIYNTKCRWVRYRHHHHHHHRYEPEGCTGSGYYVQLFEGEGKPLNGMKPFTFSLDNKY